MAFQWRPAKKEKRGGSVHEKGIGKVWNDWFTFESFAFRLKDPAAVDNPLSSKKW